MVRAKKKDNSPVVEEIHDIAETLIKQRGWRRRQQFADEMEIFPGDHKFEVLSGSIPLLKPTQRTISEKEHEELLKEILAMYVERSKKAEIDQPVTTESEPEAEEFDIIGENAELSNTAETKTTPKHQAMLMMLSANINSIKVDASGKMMQILDDKCAIATVFTKVVGKLDLRAAFRIPASSRVGGKEDHVLARAIELHKGEMGNHIRIADKALANRVSSLSLFLQHSPRGGKFAEAIQYGRRSGPYNGMVSRFAQGDFVFKACDRDWVTIILAVVLVGTPEFSGVSFGELHWMFFEACDPSGLSPDLRAIKDTIFKTKVERFVAADEWHAELANKGMTDLSKVCTTDEFNNGCAKGDKKSDEADSQPGARDRDNYYDRDYQDRRTFPRNYRDRHQDRYHQDRRYDDRSGRGNGRSNREPISCFVCHKKGHKSFECPRRGKDDDPAQKQKRDEEPTPDDAPKGKKKE